MFAAAVSRRAARRGEQPGHFHESNWLNCGTQLTGAHCHACEQAAHLHRTLGALGHDLAPGVLAFISLLFVVVSLSGNWNAPDATIVPMATLRQRGSAALSRGCLPKPWR